MVNAAATAKFPAALLAVEDVGVFGNNEVSILDSAATSGATTLSVLAADAFEAHQWLALRGPNGFELVQVDSVDAAQDDLVVERAKDGTVAVAHEEGQEVRGVIPAIALNQLRVDLIAAQTKLGTTDTSGTEGGILFADSSGNFAQDATNLFWHDTDNQLRLAATGAAAGILLGGDAQIYRSAANVLAMPSGDSLALLTDGSTGGVLFGASSDISLYRGAANRLDLATGDSFNVVNGSILTGTDAADLGTAALRWDLYSSDVRVYNAASDANPSLQLTGTALSLGPGGATAPDVSLSRGAANRLDLASGDTLHLVSGLLESATSLTLTPASGSNLNLAVAGAGGVQIAGTTVFESDRDFAVDLIPNADASLDIGSSARRLAEAVSNAFLVYGSASDANPVLKATSSGLEMGAGGASALDVLWERSAANTWRTPDSVVIGGDLTVNGTTTRVNSTEVTVDDNIIVLNDGEVGAGVTAGESGLAVDRGSLANAHLIFDETEDRWRVSYDNDDPDLATRHTLAEQAIAGAFATGSVLFSDANGRLNEDTELNWNGSQLGVGATASVGKVHVTGSGANEGLVVERTGATAGRYQFEIGAADTLLFQDDVNAATRLSINASGHVGIGGLTSAGSLLTVNPQGASVTGAGTTAATFVSDDDTGASFSVQMRNQSGATIFAVTGDRNVGIGQTAFGTNADKVLAIGDGVAPTTSPAGCGQLYVESGALKYRGSGGTVTTIASA